MARRRESLADLLSPGQETVSSSPGEAPVAVKLPVARCAPNPHNPRRSLGDLSDLADLPQRQLQSVLAVTRGAYLKLWPGEGEQLRGVDHVIVNGCRRHAASVKYGRAELTAIVDDEIAESRATLLRAALDENYNRKDFDPIEEAEAVRAIVSEYPTQAEACREQGWDKNWCSQRLSLLSLAPEVQESVRARAAGAEGMAIRDARWLAGRPNLAELSAAKQFEAVELRRAQEQEAKEAAKQHRAENRRQASSAAAAEQPGEAKQSSRAGASAELYTAVYNSGHGAAGKSEPAVGAATAGATPDVKTAGARQASPAEQASVVSPRLATDAPGTGSEGLTGDTGRGAKPEGDLARGVAIGDLGYDFIAMATPEQIVGALLSELDPDSLARVAELLLEHLPSVGLTHGA